MTMVAQSAQAAPGMIHAPHFLHAFQNWDYDENLHKWDNPVTIIFVSYAPNMVGRVYSQLAQVGMTGGGSSAIRLSGLGGSRPGVSTTDSWTSHSAGRKGANGCFGYCLSWTDIHVRTFGPNGLYGTQVYQGGYGYRPYYLVATIHYDRNEGGSNEAFGWQDTARHVLGVKMTSLHLWTTIGYTPVGNACSGWIDSKHYCESSGNAAIISIDG